MLLLLHSFAVLRMFTADETVFSPFRHLALMDSNLFSTHEKIKDECKHHNKEYSKYQTIGFRAQ